MKQDTIITKAREFAYTAHAGQFRDTPNIPYIEHPKQTAQILSNVTEDAEVIAAGWLHDVLEDTDITYDELKQEFGARIADLVNEVTNEKNPDKSGYFPRLHSKEGAMIKFADRLSNLSDMTTWSPNRQQAYINKSKFWASTAKDAQKHTKDL